MNNVATKTDIQEILEAISVFASNTEDRFISIENKMGGMKQEMGGMKQEIASIKAQMVTKAYLDDKLADLRGDLTGYDRKQDRKVDRLTRILKKRKVINTQEANAVITMSPFPQPPKA